MALSTREIEAQLAKLRRRMDALEDTLAKPKPARKKVKTPDKE